MDKPSANRPFQSGTHPADGGTTARAAALHAAAARSAAPPTASAAAASGDFRFSAVLIREGFSGHKTFHAAADHLPPLEIGFKVVTRIPLTVEACVYLFAVRTGLDDTIIE